MYPIENNTSNSSLPEFFHALFINSNHSNTSEIERSQITNLMFILNALPQERRESLARQASRVVAESSSTLEKVKVIQAFRFLLDEEKKELISKIIFQLPQLPIDDKIFLVKELQNKPIEVLKSIEVLVPTLLPLLLSEDIPIKKKFILISSFEESSLEKVNLIMTQALRIPIDDSCDLLEIIKKIEKLPVENLEFIVTQMCCVMTAGNTSTKEKLWMLSRLAHFPRENLEFIIIQTLRIINSNTIHNMSTVHRLWFIERLRRVPLENLEFIVTQILRIPTANILLLLEIIKELGIIPIEYIEFIVTQVIRIITYDSSQYKSLKIIERLTRLPLENLECTITQAIRLMSVNRLAHEVLSTIEELGKLPIENLEFIVTQTLRLVSSNMSAHEVLWILEEVGKFPIENLESVVTQTLRLGSSNMSAAELSSAMGELRKIPIENLEFIVTQTLCLMSDYMSVYDRVWAITELRRLPIENLEFIVTQALRLLTNDMSVEYRLRIMIDGLGNFPTENLEFIVEQVLFLITDDATITERFDIIERLHRERHDPTLSFQVNGLEIHTNPPKVMLDLFTMLENQSIKLLPSSIKYNNEDFTGEGIDFGGLTRSFIATLVKHFCHPDAENNLNHRLIIETESGAIPTMDDEEGVLTFEDQEKCFKIIGRFFSAAVQRYYSVVLGQHFHPIVFEMIFNLTENDLTEKNLSEVFDKMLEIYIKKQFQIPENFIKKILDNTITQELKNTYGIYSKNKFIKEYELDKKCEAILLIAKSMYQSLLDKKKWEVLKGGRVDILQDKIQGLLSKEAVIAAFPNNSNHSRNDEYMKKWIRETSYELLLKLVEAITGMKALYSNHHFTIKKMEGQDKLPVFHTCSLDIELSDYQNYDIFKEKLELSLNHCFEGSGFQIA